MPAFKQSLTYLSTMANHCVDSVLKHRETPGDAQMSAQHAQETTMEDILNSIRKIISEEDSEVPAVSSVVGRQSPNGEARKAGGEPTLPPAPQAFQTPSSPTPAHSETGSNADSREPSVSIEQGFDSKTSAGGQTSLAEPDNISSEPAAEVAPEMKIPNPFGPSIVPGDVQAEINAAHLRGQPSSLAQAGADRKEGIAGLVAKESMSAEDQRKKSDEAVENEHALHPAIENAKVFVTSQNIGSNISPAAANGKNPIFSGHEQSPSQKPAVDPAQSLGLGGATADENAHQPLKPADGLNGFHSSAFNRSNDKSELVSSDTSNAVHDSFEQLRDFTDGKLAALLRPMLRAWLDENLPSIVEDLVRKEIECLSGGR
jgi:cell pole-organizing protein PopZ